MVPTLLLFINAERKGQGGKIVSFIMKFYNQERETSEIQIHDVDEYEYPYLYTHNLSNLYA